MSKTFEINFQRQVIHLIFTQKYVTTKKKNKVYGIFRINFLWHYSKRVYFQGKREPWSHTQPAEMRIYN